MSQALAQTISYVNRARSFMPPGTVSPFVIRFDAGTLPVGYLVFSGKVADRSANLLDRLRQAPAELTLVALVLLAIGSLISGLGLSGRRGDHERTGPL